ncbi:putative acetyl-CoA synthetase [Flavobacterium cauense R2A-7]|uniref:2-aminobenzoate-CoA ligase n=1 Tax=Flavobacterium cauense R2A-7 TaxID=1341154 RepID=V6RXA3_9FLAO|nr:AMP-binding protein [Flavobacterium cauense]ESU18789.1 putative acetyl-CoA synthetase [Flavobacterium cauense R2A-7]KGO81739.1 2-aminobenzoate-CoA ligase [Flavobacterium cauense R2A-7]TWI13770.1 2-aminobenzoate-CoA ligase [Flavobacterium cauense R2A-7]
MKHYEDNFAHNSLPAPELQPDYIFENLPQFQHPEMLNCVERLLDFHIKNGHGNATCIQTFEEKWTYNDLYEKANQIAHVLIDDLGLKSGNRVLIRSANNPMMVACWYAILKAGGVVVATMPLLRSKELTTIIDCAEISHVLCDSSLCEEMELVDSPFLRNSCYFRNSELEDLMQSKPKTFNNYHTKSDSIALIGFTSGTTGLPKMTAHYHKDILNICEAFPPYSLQPTSSDVFTGSPPLGFTFGLGGLVLFPMYFGASTFLIEKPTPDLLLQAIQEYKVTVCFTAPTAWRIITTKVKEYDISSLRKCVSAGETLPLKVWEDWYNATGLKIIDGIGATEMLHIFISSNEGNMKPGSTGVAVTGYEAKIIDSKGNEAPRNTPGRLAVRGITGCKYLNREEKQREYVENGWNLTGDIFRQDEDGYFWFVARGDDMIISSGYNIAAIEVESVLLTHEEILECAVVGLPDEERGMLVCAHIVLKEKHKATDELVKAIQLWFKEVAAPYKYPRVINFMENLPKTETGKIQRFKLK